MRILTACYQVVLLPLCDFGELPRVVRDIYYAAALFLVRTAHPDLTAHIPPRPLPSSLRTLELTATSMLGLKISSDMDRRLHSLITARHVQALRADLRAETLSHAAELTSHTTLLVFGKSDFVGNDEAGHGRSTVGLTRARDTTILLGPSDPYGLTGLVQTTCAYYFGVHTAYFCWLVRHQSIWSLPPDLQYSIQD